MSAREIGVRVRVVRVQSKSKSNIAEDLVELANLGILYRAPRKYLVEVERIADKMLLEVEVQETVYRVLKVGHECLLTPDGRLLGHTRK